jgi:hypothetical protein
MELAMASADAKFKSASRHFAPDCTLCAVTVALQQFGQGLCAASKDAG